MNEQIKAGSKLLAEFLELESTKEPWENGEGAYTVKFPDAYNMWVIPSQMKFHSSYDWLMLVWQKFRDLNFKEKTLEYNTHEYYCNEIPCCITECLTPEPAFDRLVEAVTWYNSLKPKS